jgi:hypothetical protein
MMSISKDHPDQIPGDSIKSPKGEKKRQMKENRKILTLQQQSDQ